MGYKIYIKKKEKEKRKWISFFFSILLSVCCNDGYFYVRNGWKCTNGLGLIEGRTWRWNTNDDLVRDWFILIKFLHWLARINDSVEGLGGILNVSRVSARVHDGEGGWG